MPPKFARIPDSSDRHSARDVERQSLLDGDSEEDDFFLNGPRVNTQRLNDPKIGRLRGQVEEVVDVMKDNVTKVIERGDRLEDLQDKSDSLANNSDMFRNRAKALHKTMWWKNCKMRLIMAFVIILILSIIIIPIIVSQVNKNKGG
ncbi:vesicle-associated membrane protein 4-like [Mercenaria mercenaria]|uniref:vesicle-associated membrane protein 4-like n=1 Tax=Mercenaria mercenaria TaxID=6596 RepID=UPI001E1D4641|nr:vesicle-associated membrane protein 4-like [Mercenaria mercenaria]